MYHAQHSSTHSMQTVVRDCRLARGPAPAAMLTTDVSGARTIDRGLDDDLDLDVTAPREPARATAAESRPPARRSGAERRAAQLRVLLGVDAGTELSLGNREVAIGRGSRCELRLTDATVSRTHVRVELRRGLWVLCDGSSSNGTFVNGKPLRGEKTLQSGDLIRIGKTSMRYLERDPSGGPDDPDATMIKPAIEHVSTEARTREDASGCAIRALLGEVRHEEFDPEQSVEAALAAIALLENDHSDIKPAPQPPPPPRPRVQMSPPRPVGRAFPPPPPRARPAALPPPLPPPLPRPSAIGRPVDLGPSELPALFRPGGPAAPTSKPARRFTLPPRDESMILIKRIGLGAAIAVAVVTPLLLILR